MYDVYQKEKEIYAGLTNAYGSGTPYSYLNNHSTTAVNPNYVPPASVKQDGTTGTWEGYKIQKVSLEPGDVLLCHISASMRLSDCQSILKELQEAFPNNTVMLCNEQVLKGMTFYPDKTYQGNLFTFQIIMKGGNKNVMWNL